MAVEIERKFLLKNEQWKAKADIGCFYRQGYLVSSGDMSSVRIRSSSHKAWVNIKSAEAGMTRLEYEYEIPLADADEMLDRLCAKPIVEKTRYLVENGDHTWEIDVFSGCNAGLVVAEIELGDENEPIDFPSWVGEEVTDDKRYYNVYLVQHPYSDWSLD